MRRSLLGRISVAAAARRRRPGAARVAAFTALARQHVVTVAALTAVDIGCWQASPVAGWIVAGVSALVLDFAVTG